jgi:hypothetical protein
MGSELNLDRNQKEIRNKMELSPDIFVQVFAALIGFGMYIPTLSYPNRSQPVPFAAEHLKKHRRK